MTDTGAINFDPPLCLDGVTGNIVVVLDIPSFLVAQDYVPAAQGYGLRPAGLAIAGQPSQVFVRLSCADAAGQFIRSRRNGLSVQAADSCVASTESAACTDKPLRRERAPQRLDSDELASGVGAAQAHEHL